MTLNLLAIAIGLVVLAWSADRFIDGAATVSRHLGVSPLVIGVLIVGFGTSAPEMVVSAMAALDGRPDLGLGNAYGSNIVNSGLILGLTALAVPLSVHSTIVRKELPLLLGVGVLSGFLLLDGALTRLDAGILLAGFFGLVGWSLFAASRGRGDVLAEEMDQELKAHPMSVRAGWFWLASGLVLLVVSSRVLVWGAVGLAQMLGVSDLIIGLTIVALGTSLPELAASLSAARKGEHDIAIGNIVGSNMFNLLAVVGIACAIVPIAQVPAAVLSRDWLTMMIMTAALFAFAYGFRGKGRINRIEGGLLLVIYAVYNIYLVAAP